MTILAALWALHEDPSDTQAWEAIYRDQQPRLLAYVSSLLVTFQIPPSEGAADIVHDVMVKCLMHWTNVRQKIATPEHLNRYLRKSCRHQLVDQYRTAQQAQHLVRFLSLQFADAFRHNTSVHRSIFLKEVIELLPTDCGDLLRRYVTEDISPADIADEQGLNPSTAYTRWYRCIQKARDAYERRSIAPD